MKPVEKRTVAKINPGRENVAPRKNEMPAAVTSAVPSARCFFSADPNRKTFRDRGGSRTLLVS
jgi:hypothetical protein